jgi:hypothetical protein
MKRAAALLCVLGLAGCGAAERPKLPAELGREWARSAELIAGARRCDESRSIAEKLRASVITAINARRVPPSLQEPLTSKVNALAARPGCSEGLRQADELAAWLRENSKPE